MRKLPRALRRMFAANGAVGQIRDRTVGEGKAGDHVVLADRVFEARGKRGGKNLNRLRVEQPVHEINKMTGLTENRAPDGRIRHPVRA